VLLATATGACVSVKPVVVDRNTEPENEIRGSCQRLRRDLRLTSTRTPDEIAQMKPQQRQLLQALLDRQLFAPAVDRLKQQRVVGEGRDGLLAVLSEPLPADKPVIAAENNARTVLMQGVIASSKALTEADLPAVRQVFYELHAAAARPGEQVQGPRGKWRTVNEGD